MPTLTSQQQDDPSQSSSHNPHRLSADISHPMCVISCLLQAVGGLLAQRPHIWIVPLALLGLMIGLGVWGVMKGADSYYASQW